MLENTNIMKKSCMISRIFLSIITFILFQILFINEDISWKILPFIFSLIVFVISYPSSIVSKKLIHIGDKLERKKIKILYYAIILPIILFLLLGVIIGIMYFIFELFPTQNEFGAALGQGLLFLFMIIVITIFLVVPYIQTLIILIIRHFVKKSF